MHFFHRLAQQSCRCHLSGPPVGLGWIIGDHRWTAIGRQPDWILIRFSRKIKAQNSSESIIFNGISLPNILEKMMLTKGHSNKFQILTISAGFQQLKMQVHN